MNTEDTNIENTMNGLNGIKRPVASPLLVDRIMKSVESVEAKIVDMSPMQRWSIAAGIVLLITLNVFSAKQYSGGSKSSESNAFEKEYFSYLNNQY
ncbi:MAG: hypothetical protein Q8M29_02235 [Bacteroidota bacterium]|nr:hypothetical protein [Bacteroidota bacterium]